ncbi:MAG: two-component regulator propeller domain-containing protein, partial [Pseudomonadota bacterium]
MGGNFVVALIEGQNGYIWAGTNNGLSKFDGLKWESIPGVKKAVTSLWSDENGLWVGTPDGLWQLGQDSLIKQSLAGLRISCIKRIDGQLVVGTNAGLFQHNGSKWEAITTARGRRPDIWDISQDSLGHIWVASLGQGLFSWEGQKLVPIREPGAPSRFTTSVLIGPDHRLWVGTQDQGIFLRNPSDSTWTKLGQRQGLPANYVHSMTMDAWGQIW